MSYQYPTLKDAANALAATGNAIKEGGIPPELGPLVFTFTGKGNVFQGATRMFKQLPHEWVAPNDLKSLVSSSSFDPHRLYGCNVNAKDYLVRHDGGSFVATEYKSTPSLYTSIFHTKIAPYTSMLINGLYWDARYPRILTKEQYKSLYETRGDPRRLTTIADISCDINGPIEFMSRASTIDEPYFMYDPVTDSTHDDIKGHGNANAYARRANHVD